MKELGYKIAFAFLYTLSLMPFWLWYGISNGLFLLIYKGLGYRKKVVYDNISKSFPKMSKEGHEAIMERFYRHLCDVLVETIKAMSMSDKAVKKRVTVENPEVWQEFMDLKEGAVLMAGHYGNFEMWGSMLDILVGTHKQGYCIYTPQKSYVLNKLIHYSRVRRGGRLLARREYVRRVRELTSKGNFIVVLADQSPQKSQRAYYTSFLGRPTAFFTSTAKYCLELNLPLFFIEVKKPRRGHYSLRFHRLPKEDYLPYSLENVHAYTDLQVEHYEKMIQRDPAFWLWSHKRWKRPPGPKDKLSPKLAKLS